MRYVLAILLLCFAVTGPQARPYQQPITQFNGDRYGAQLVDAKYAHPSRQARRGADRVGVVIGGRPSGCPHRFCGCALSLHIFGKIIPTLNLARNWRTFPSAVPAPGMVAVRSGHVFKLVAHVKGSTWTVWDANSGRGRIRIHERSIAGYVIVNPHGARRA